MVGCVVIFLGIVVYIIFYFKKTYSFWEEKNVPVLPPTIPFGNFRKFLFQQTSIGEQILEFYNKLRDSNSPYYGVYLLTKPALLLLDPDVVKEVMVKEFPNFLSRQRQENPNEPLSYHLVNVSGSQWKFLRTKLTPTFTSGRMKYMFNTMADCGKELKTVINVHVDSKNPVEIKDLMARFTTDVISSCAFGVECNSIKDPDNEFRRQGRLIFQLSKWEQFKNVFLRFFPIFSKLLRLKRVTKETVDFFLNLVSTTVAYRENNNTKRNDFMDLLIQLKSKGFLEDEIDNKSVDTTKLSKEQLAAQCFLFFLAGFETSSTTLSATMYELAKNQKVQNIAREEIRNVLEKYQGQLTYEALIEMVYLEQILDETLRLHLPISFLSRKCTSDYTFSDGKLKIEKGMTIFISAKGFHKDPKYFPDPEKFDPERFSIQEKSKRLEYVYLPFGAGPRQCIGLRFAKLQMKIGLIALLKDHKYTLNPKTPTPLKINPRSSFNNFLSGIWLNAEKCA